MSIANQETVLSVRHWNDTLMSFTTTRDRGLRFKNGHFVMIGLEVEGKPLMRAFSFASPNYEDTSSSTASRFRTARSPRGCRISRSATRSWSASGRLARWS